MRVLGCPAGAAILMTYMFIGFHILCDDFFVPALNVLCEKFGLPDDIAGATFMAAGCASPLWPALVLSWLPPERFRRIEHYHDMIVAFGFVAGRRLRSCSRL